MRNHIVDRVRISLPASDYENARNLQKNAQNWSSHFLPGLLEKSLDEFSKNGDFIFIEKIEIELTKFPWQLTESEWIQKLDEKISEFRSSKIPVEIILEHWVFYLKNGSFERNAIISNIKEIESYFLKVNLKFTGSEPGFLSRIFSSENTIKRLFLSHSENFVRFFLEHFFVLEVNKARQLYQLFKNRLVLNQQVPFEAIKNLNELVLKNRMDLVKEMVDLILNNSESLKIDEIIRRENIMKENPEEDENDAETNIYLQCENAGLVLLLPFIKPFFENLGFVKDDVFIDESSKLKACNVLHFLATGRKAEEEPELLLPKILCDIEIQEFVEPVEIHEKYIKSESNDLLKSVIQHWEVLKSTSVESLRETFLQRDGQLKIESVFTLQVSNSGVDILLSKLPWGFRNYKLPWMQKSIITEWH